MADLIEKLKQVRGTLNKVIGLHGNNQTARASQGEKRKPRQPSVPILKQ